MAGWGRVAGMSGDDKFIRAVQKRLPDNVRIEYLSATTQWVLVLHDGKGFPVELRRIENEDMLNWRKPLDVFASIARYESRQVVR